MENSRISLKIGHSRDKQTDSLYEPLRKTLLTDTRAKKSLLESITRYSSIASTPKVCSSIENFKIGQNTLIPEDTPLKVRKNLNDIRLPSKYSLINASERYLTPITEEQLRQRINRKQNQQIRVYEYDFQYESQPSFLNLVESRLLYQQTKEPIKNKLKTYKYNLFSSIDEPINNWISNNFSNLNCFCAPNQLIATKPKNQIGWDFENFSKSYSNG